jgi:hypothetical protein
MSENQEYTTMFYEDHIVTYIDIDNFQMVLDSSFEMEFGFAFCGGRKTGEPGDNRIPRSKGENQQTTQSTPI